MTETDYESGKRDGRIQALEAMQARLANRLDSHEKRLQLQEKITYGLLGAISLIEFGPAIKGLIGS